MTRRRWIQQKDGSLIEVSADSPPSEGFFVRGDIPAYKSMITGEMIEGRSQHRAHLRQHGCVEVGNDLDNAKPREVYQPGNLKRTLIDVFNSRT